MKWFSENWFKLIVTIIFLLIGISVFYYYVIFLPKKEQSRLDLDKAKAAQEILQQQKKDQLVQEQKDQGLEDKYLAQVNLDKCLLEESNNYTFQWLQTCNSRGLLPNDCKKFADSSYTSEQFTTENHLSYYDGLKQYIDKQNECSCRLPSSSAESIETRTKQNKDECFKKYPQ